MPVGSSRVADKTNFQTRNLICVPIKVQNRILGVIQVLNKVGGKHFTDQDVKLLEAMTMPAGVAIENARMYKRLQKTV
ncbi:GAF domain-containing protein [Paenibacillus sp. TAB 01]|uniref:GAF domain-containing protein n=1 Tax=Paenibacillus sp. TAB 01 TaxID=3368988 RepID=UPI003751C228